MKNICVLACSKIFAILQFLRSWISLSYCIHGNFSDLTIIAIVATKLRTLLMLNIIHLTSLFLVIYILVIYTQVATFSFHQRQIAKNSKRYYSKYCYFGKNAIVLEC